MKPIRMQEAARAMATVAECEGNITSVCTDTRALQQGCLFFAIRGENYDGHDYAKRALEAGAIAVVCERDCGCGKQALQVNSTRQALLDFAAYYRSLFDIPVVGITGSIGKTTTKEMTAQVLESQYHVLKNVGNRNNEIGLPMTIFDLDDTHEVAVLEMGMNHLGEIARLSQCAKPTVAIITNIGISHIENLGTKENIRRAKMEILTGMPPESPVILNGDDAMLYQSHVQQHPVYYYGVENAHCRFQGYDIESKSGKTQFCLEYGMGEETVLLPSMGRHNVYNALAAFAAGFLLGVTPKNAVRALAAYTPAGMRQRVRIVQNITVIEDCYNASPDSQKAALQVLHDTQATRHIAVLGDMLELGDASREAHAMVGKQAALQGVDILLAYGKESCLSAQSAKENGVPEVLHFLEKQALTDALLARIQSGDAVLFKASRGMQLEDVLDVLYGRLTEAGTE